MSWAKFPIAWLKINPENRNSCALNELKWSDSRSTGTAALIILIGLALKLNLSKTGKEFDDAARHGELVSVTYDELQEFTGFARATISSGLEMLERLGAIERRKEGRSNSYRLINVSVDKFWVQLPQSHIVNGGRTVMRRLRSVPHGTKQGLNAMKLYVLLLTFRNRRWNKTKISYPLICEYTGIRREEIPGAISLLSALELIYVASPEDEDRTDGTNLYKIRGLNAVG